MFTQMVQQVESVSVMIAWQRWNRGYKRSGVNHNESVRPFKDIQLSDLKGNEFKKVRKRWSDWKFVMSWIEAELDKKITVNYCIHGEQSQHGSQPPH